MEKASYMPTADTNELSLCGSKPGCLQLDTELKPNQELTYCQKIYQEEKKQPNQMYQDENKEREPSFIDLKGSTQLKISKMIRKQIEHRGTMNKKMTLLEDQICICTSDIYSKENQHWKNRQITQLTNKRLDCLPVKQITKVKLLNQYPMAGYNLFRVTVGEKQVKDFAIRSIDIPIWFSNTIWVCLVNSGHQINMKKQFQGDVSGDILKKSQFLGNWELRHVSISTKNGLMSFKKKNSIVSVKLTQSPQVWTRLEVLEHDGKKYVVFKTWQMMFKYQFGVPINDVVRWAKAFCVLVK